MSENPVVIFGVGDVAELAKRYLEEAGRTVVSFTLDRDFVKDERFCDLDVLPFEELFETYPPAKYDVFVGLGYSKVNALRKTKYEAIKALGYTCPSIISPHATVLNDGQIGENCFIFEDNTIQPFVSIGDNVTLWSGNHIGHHTRIEDHCFLASHIVVSGRVVIGESCFVGVNAAFRDHISIGPRNVIGAGALILNNVEPDGLYIGTETDRASLPSHKLRKI